MLAESCALLGTGCRENVLARGGVELDFWLPAGRAAAAGEALCAHLSARGLRVGIRTAREDDAWRDAMLAFHQPIEIAGRLLVRPPWTPPRLGLSDVVIDPGMAFGTGQHATTRACLELLAGLAPTSLLDAGCGSGVLAIAARRLGYDPVRAIDDDPLALEATIHNARANGVGLTVGRRRIGRDPLPHAETLVANLTTTLLVALAGALAQAGPTRAILSGIQHGEEGEVLGTFALLGLREGARIEDDAWVTLLLAG